MSPTTPKQSTRKSSRKPVPSARLLEAVANSAVDIEEVFTQPVNPPQPLTWAFLESQQTTGQYVTDSDEFSVPSPPKRLELPVVDVSATDSNNTVAAASNALTLSANLPSPDITPLKRKDLGDSKKKKGAKKGIVINTQVTNYLIIREKVCY